VTVLARALAVVQALLAVRVFARMARSARGSVIAPVEPDASANESVTVLLPVLDEAARIEPCLDGLAMQGPEVAAIVVADGGSTDGTQAIVRRWAERDPRIRMVDAAPVPEGINGKAHNLRVGLDHAPGTPWVLTIDADVRPAAGLVPALLAHAAREGILAMSVATRQRLSGPAEALVHPAMLTTLVYRFGIPGNVTTSRDAVQANGQCFLVRREVLDAAGGFAAVTGSICEDVTLARTIAGMGYSVGFFEAGDLVDVEMYAGWRDAWVSWSRSLPMRDRYSGLAGRVGLAEVLLVQAAPPWLAAGWGAGLGRREPATLLNLGLAMARLGVLGGTARAYRRPPATYWLSPLADLPVAIRLMMMWRQRSHRWRGRTVRTGDAE
jgi:dolichol-phosphate mannosyltransferase